MLNAQTVAPVGTHPSSNLKTLRNEMTHLGCNKKATGRILGELALHLMIAFGGIAVFVASDSLWVRACAMVVSTLGSMGAGTNTHTSSHHGTSTKKWLNDLLTYFGYPVFLGLSATYWRYMHIVRHHPAPNVPGMDMDHDLMPWFSVLRKPIEKTAGLRRFYHDHVQWLLFPLILGVNGFNLQRAGWQHLWGDLRRPGSNKKATYIDIGAMLAHYLVWIVLPAAFFPLSNVLLFYLLRISLMGYAMFAVLAPGHFPAEAICLEKVDKTEDDFALRQAATSLNFRTGFIGRLLCSGLEYQIEHHLFPNLSHNHYPRVRPVVEKFCRDNGYPYRMLGWGEAIWKSFKVLRFPKPIHSNLTSIRIGLSLSQKS
jgi:fatty acid desaturase